jgi:hypothetical protein
LSSRAAVKTNAGAAANTDESKVRFARNPGAVDQLWDGTIDQPMIHVKAYEPTYERRNPNNRATPLSVDRP